MLFSFFLSKKKAKVKKTTAELTSAFYFFGAKRSAKKVKNIGKHSKKLHSRVSGILNKTSINYVNVIGKNIVETYKNVSKNKKGHILKKNSQIINLIKNYINNNDYLMVKGSNSTGLNKLTNTLKAGKINVL